MKCPYCAGTGSVNGTADLPNDVYCDSAPWATLVPLDPSTGLAVRLRALGVEGAGWPELAAAAVDKLETIDRAIKAGRIVVL